jgi:anti-anti-sigma regulatory factor
MPPDEEGLTMKVEGRLTVEYVDELARAARHAIADSSRLILDMADVSFVDQRGAELLRLLRGEGVEFSRCSQFVRTLMNGGLK